MLSHKSGINLSFVKPVHRNNLESVNHHRNAASWLPEGWFQLIPLARQPMGRDDSKTFSVTFCRFCFSSRCDDTGAEIFAAWHSRL